MVKPFDFKIGEGELIRIAIYLLENSMEIRDIYPEFWELS